MTAPIPQINGNSLRSIYIEMRFDEQVLSSGTAFFARTEGRVLLFTNRHNVTGRNNDTGAFLSKKGGIPNNIKVMIPMPQTISENQDKLYGQKWVIQYLNLYFDDNFEHPVWIEHPKRDKIDAVGIIVEGNDFDIDQLAFDVGKSWYNWEVGETINVLGYPYGLSVHKFPIWMTGYIASEPSMDFDNLPVLLIDCRTRSGQSGSPVVGRHKPGDIIEYNGQQYSPKIEISHLLGIYSGRINSESDLGKVWKAEALREILLYGIQVGNPHWQSSTNA